MCSKPYRHIYGIFFACMNTLQGCYRFSYLLIIENCASHASPSFNAPFKSGYCTNINRREKRPTGIRRPSLHLEQWYILSRYFFAIYLACKMCYIYYQCPMTLVNHETIVKPRIPEFDPDPTIIHWTQKCTGIRFVTSDDYAYWIEKSI